MHYVISRLEQLGCLAFPTYLVSPHPNPNIHRAPAPRPPGILYADVGVDLSNILLEDMPILGLFSRIMMETGTSDMDRVQLSRRIGSQTGGVYATFLADQPSAGGAVADPGALKQYLFLRGKVGFVGFGLGCGGMRWENGAVGWIGVCF